jgi:hypothetical protein
MMKKGFYVFVAFFVMNVFISYGDEVAGYPGRIEGRCEVLRKGIAEKITRGTSFLKGDIIRTYENGKVEIILLDETVIKIGPNAELNLSDFLLDEAGSRRKGIVKLIRGSIMTFLRRVYKGIKGEFSVETPTAVVGVRGTKFIVSVYSPSQTEIIALEDSVNVDTPYGSIVLEEGYMTSVFEGEAPSPPQSFDPQRIEEFIKGIEPSAEEPPEGGLEGGMIEILGEPERAFLPEGIYNKPPVEQTLQTGTQDIFNELRSTPVKIKIIFPR